MGSWSWTGVLGTEHLEIGSSLISFQPNVKDLGVVLDSSLTVCDHICSVCCSAYLALCRIAFIHPFLTVEAAAELAHASSLELTTAILLWLELPLNRLPN